MFCFASIIPHLIAIRKCSLENYGIIEECQYLKYLMGEAWVMFKRDWKAFQVVVALQGVVQVREAPLDRRLVTEVHIANLTREHETFFFDPKRIIPQQRQTLICCPRLLLREL